MIQRHLYIYVSVLAAMLVPSLSHAKDKRFSDFSHNIEKFYSSAIHLCKEHPEKYMNQENIIGPLKDKYNLRLACGRGMNRMSLSHEYQLFYSREEDSNALMDVFGMEKELIHGDDKYKLIVSQVSRRDTSQNSEVITETHPDARMFKLVQGEDGEIDNELVWVYVNPLTNDWIRPFPNQDNLSKEMASFLNIVWHRELLMNVGSVAREVEFYSK